MHGALGSVEHAVASGLALRYDGGPCFRSEHYQAEIDHLGIARSPAFHYEPETNGCAEKSIQTLKEQVLWIERFETLEKLGSPPCAHSAAPTKRRGRRGASGATSSAVSGSSSRRRSTGAHSLGNGLGVEERLVE
ncbi:MAG: hypothetical protein ACRDN8_24150 [Thermoleophilaceae bacterium]